MENALVVSAGCLGMVIALIHGYLGETRVVRAAKGLSESQLRVLQAVMFLSATYWFIGGAVLAVAPVFLTANQQFIAAIVVGAMYLTGAIGNAWATRGRHIGWVLLTLAVVLAWGGALAIARSGP